MIKKQRINRYMSKKSLLFVLLLFSMSTSGFDKEVFAEVKNKPINGTWIGTIDGEGGPPATRVLFHAEMRGTFEGNTSSGEWIGEFDSNYTISPMGLEDEDTGIVTGTYTAAIDDVGRLFGEGKAKVTGVLTGEIEFKFHSTASTSNLDEPLPGNWNGTLTSQSFTYGGTPIEMMLKLSCSGEFEGVIKSNGDESQTISPTTSMTTSKSITTTKQTTTTIEGESKNQQPITLMIVFAVIGIVIVSGVYVLRKRMKK